MAYFIDKSQALKHFGILGMKWGIRRYQNKDGSLTPLGKQKYGQSIEKTKNTKKLTYSTQQVDHTQPKHEDIPAGTTFYRMSLKESDIKEGKPIYVTYDELDRDFYKGQYGDEIRYNSGVNDNAPLYEQTMTNKQTLKVASYQEVIDTAKQVFVENEKVQQAVGKAHADKWLRENGARTLKEAASYLGTTSEGAKKQYADEIAWQITNTKFLIDNPQNYKEASGVKISQTFGQSPYVKKEVINKLKAQGYNTMVDVAGVGALIDNNKNLKNRGREGNDPLIIFDSSILDTPKSHLVSDEESKESKDRVYYEILERHMST